MNKSECSTETIRQRICEEAVRRRESLLGRRLEEAKSQQEQIEELVFQLEESEADRAARLIMHKELAAKLEESDADRGARLISLNELTAKLEESEADRAARMDAINELTALLKESEADRAARLEVIHDLEERITGLQADMEAESRRTEDAHKQLREFEETFAVRMARYLGLSQTGRFARRRRPAPASSSAAEQVRGEGLTIMVNEINQGKGAWFRAGMQRLYQIPVAGYLIRIFTAIIRLPKIMEHLNHNQMLTDARLAEKADREPAAEAHLLDAMYLSFEDRFRGTREEIKRKLSVYLPSVAEACAVARKETVSILDVGCGRGEWLELLQENGYRAKGVDFNRVAIGQCRQRGLDVTEADVIEHLRGAERGSVDVITGFHVIEHLSFKTLIAFFDEALSVLKIGGMIILESPNPANILISAYDFYRDPTHIRPLHPDTIRFFADNRGFVRTALYFVADAGGDTGTDSKSIPILISAADWKLDDINDYIRAPRDFALIGYRGEEK